MQQLNNIFLNKTLTFSKSPQFINLPHPPSNPTPPYPPSQIRSNSKFQYIVKPNSGLIAPSCSLPITFILQPLKSFQPELFQNDKFQIIFVGPVDKEVDVAKVWNGKEFRTRKV